MMEMRYFIHVFQEQGDNHIAKIVISQDEYKVITKMLGCKEDEPLYYSFPVKDDVLKKAFSILGERLCQGEYEYFLEAELCTGTE